MDYCERERLTERKRREALWRLQERMQGIWDRIDAEERHAPRSVTLERLKREFAAAEAREGTLLRRGAMVGEFG